MLTISCSQTEKEHRTATPTIIATPTTIIVIAKDDELLSQYDNSDTEYKKLEIADAIVYWHNRMIGEARVQGDRIRYEFDKDTKELREQDKTWRDDLPECLPDIISEEEVKTIAASMTSDEIGWARLVYIAPDSIFYPTPTPINPCWEVYVIDDAGWNTAVFIIDAVTGEFLGYGVPYP